MNCSYLGSYPIYTFYSDTDLVDKILPEVEKLKFTRATTDPREKIISAGYKLLEDGKLVSYYNKELYDWFDQCLAKVAEVHLKDINLKIVDLWAIKSNFFDKGRYHIHNNSMFSAVYYLTDCNHSETLFETEDRFYNQWRFLIADRLKKNPQTLAIKPEKGKLVIWPSDLPHTINVHTEKHIRYSISFNAMFESNETYPARRVNLTVKAAYETPFEIPDGYNY